MNGTRRTAHRGWPPPSAQARGVARPARRQRQTSPRRNDGECAASPGCRHPLDLIKRDRQQRDHAADLERPVVRGERHRVGNKITRESGLGSEFGSGRLGRKPILREQEPIDSLVPTFHTGEECLGGATVASGKRGAARPGLVEVLVAYRPHHAARRSPS